MTDLRPKILVTSININGMGSPIIRKSVFKCVTKQTECYDVHIMLKAKWFRKVEYKGPGKGYIRQLQTVRKKDDDS